MQQQRIGEVTLRLPAVLVRHHLRPLPLEGTAIDEPSDALVEEVEFTWTKGWVSESSRLS